MIQTFILVYLDLTEHLIKILALIIQKNNNIINNAKVGVIEISFYFDTNQTKNI